MRYRLRVLGAGGPVSEITLDSASREDAQREAVAQGYTVLAVAKDAVFLGNLGVASRFPLLLFCQELLALLDAGISLQECMETLSGKELQPDVRKVLDTTSKALHEGKPFSSALERSPKAFPPLLVALVRSSERTGDLSAAITRFVAYRTRVDLLRNKLITASIYPVLLIFTGLLVGIFLLGYVVPRFSMVYENLNAELPFASKILLRWGELVQAHGSVMLGGLCILIAAVIGLLLNAESRTRIINAVWKIPALGYRLRIYQLARFYRTLGMLVGGGIPLLSAIEMSQDLLPLTMREQLDHAARDIREGKSASDSLERYQLTTPIALRMLRVGERSGRLSEMLDKVADFHDMESAQWVEWFTRMFEPLLMVAIGLFVGAIVTLMYMPIFDLAGSLQ